MKKLFLIIFLIILGVIVYYFIPKTITTSCGTALPITCTEATCKTGFPFRSTDVLNITCLFGGDPIYNTVK